MKYYLKLRILVAVVVVVFGALEFFPQRKQNVRELNGRVMNVQLAGAGDVISVTLDTGNIIKFAYVRWDTSPLAELKIKDELELTVFGNYEVNHELWGSSARMGGKVLYSEAIQERHQLLERIAAVLLIISGLSYLIYASITWRKKIGVGVSRIEKQK